MGPAGIVLVLSLTVACGQRGSGPDAPDGDSTRVDAPAMPPGTADAPEIPQRVQLTSAAMAEAGIQTWKVQSIDLEHLLVLTGSVGYDEDHLLQVASNVKGRVASMPVDLGARVHRGQTLLWVESVELSHAWDEFVSILAELRVAERSFERARSLLDSKAISLGEYQSREATYLSKKVEAETADRTLRIYGEPEEEISAVRAAVDSSRPLPDGGQPHRLSVAAPFNGRVIDRKVTPGSLVEALQPLITVADLSSVWVFLQAYEKDLALLQDGLAVKIRTEAYPQETFHGTVDFLASVVDETTRTVRVRATVENRLEKLRPGMFVRAQVEVPRPSKESRLTLAVPESALQSLEGRTCVFVQEADGIFRRRMVETGHTFEGFTEVLSGVHAGDVVVTEGSFVLKGEFARATLVEED